MWDIGALGGKRGLSGWGKTAGNVAEGCLERGEVWGLRGEVLVRNLRGQVMDPSRERLKSSCDVDA